MRPFCWIKGHKCGNGWNVLRFLHGCIIINLLGILYCLLNLWCEVSRKIIVICRNFNLFLEFDSVCSSSSWRSFVYASRLVLHIFVWFILFYSNSSILSKLHFDRRPSTKNILNSWVWKWKAQNYTKQYQRNKWVIFFELASYSLAKKLENKDYRERERFQNVYRVTEKLRDKKNFLLLFNSFNYKKVTISKQPTLNLLRNI